MNLLAGIGFVLLVFLLLPIIQRSEQNKFEDDVCGHLNGRRIYLEYEETGTLIAKYENNIFNNLTTNTISSQKSCTVQFISCPSCIVKIKFKFLNLSRNCGRSTVFDTCGCDYVWIYEPKFEQSSEQFCGRFIDNNVSTLHYRSQTRNVVVAFFYNNEYKHAFTLDYFSKRNRINLTGFPKLGNINNVTQTISSPFFPNLYPSDLTMEHVINCKSGNETCRISLVFTDFLVAHSSILDFFDWNGERIYVTSENIFRPPVITSSGSSLVLRFYANGASNFGYKAHYSFILGEVSDKAFKPDIDCGGHVNNLGGGITMMDMVQEGLKSFDCIWLIKPPDISLHMKTHLYVKVVTFSEFAGSTELTIHQGLTSNGPVVENLKLSLARFHVSKDREHVVPISEGFYISLKGLFRTESRLTLVYAAFNYKDCLAGSDFLCHNLRCISILLNCDGFDHCGDNSDEFPLSCSKDPHDRRQWSKIPNFLFPKVEGLTDLTVSTLIFLLCCFGCCFSDSFNNTITEFILGVICLIFAMIVLQYKINLKTRHQRQIQDHIETINAILDEAVGDEEEEIIIPDDPPDYEAPPDYDDVVKKMCIEWKAKSNRCKSITITMDKEHVQGTSRSCQTVSVRIPDSPPPAYDDKNDTANKMKSSENCNLNGACSSTIANQYNTIPVFNNSLLWSPKTSKNCVGGSVIRSARRLWHLVDDESKKYFSDSELVFLSTGLNHKTAIRSNTIDISNYGSFKRSFTANDIYLSL